MKMKNNTLWGIFILLAVLGIGYFVFTSGNAQTVGNTVVDNGDIQIVKMHVEGGSYILEPDTVKKGIPVRIEADMSRMPGCSKSIVIPEFNIRKSVNGNNNKIEFIPNKAGTFNIACSMNMYKGTFTVLESDGTKTDYIEQANSEVAACGAEGGGCGCGG